MKNIKEMSIDEILNYSVPYNDEYVITIPDFHKLYTEKNKKLDPKLEAICHDLEEKMKGILGTKVAINQKDNKKGQIEIEYYSMDELDRIMDLFRTIEK